VTARTNNWGRGPPGDQDSTIRIRAIGRRYPPPFLQRRTAAVRKFKAAEWALVGKPTLTVGRPSLCRAGVTVETREASFFGTPAHVPANAPPIGVHRCLFGSQILPLLPSAIRLRTIRAHAPLRQFADHPSAVIPLVDDQLARPFRAHLLHCFILNPAGNDRPPQSLSKM
jgi:hypothetical protein